MRPGYMELQGVRITQPFLSIVHFPGGLTGGTGVTLHVTADCKRSVSSLLPRPFDGRFLAVAQMKSKIGNLSAFYSVDYNSVYAALKELCSRNPLYKDVVIRNLSAAERSLQSECVHKNVKLRRIDVGDSYPLMNFSSSVPPALREPNYFDNAGNLRGEERMFGFNDNYENRIFRDRAG